MANEAKNTRSAEEAQSNTPTFWGRHEVRLDAKGRMTIPADYRKQHQKVQLSGDFCLVSSPADKCIIAFDQHQSFFTDEEQITIAPFADAAHMDDQKRIRLSDELQKTLGLGKKGGKVTCVGCRDFFEIWASEQWKKVEPLRLKQLEKVLSISTPPVTLALRQD